MSSQSSPQIIVSLSNQGELVTELPGLNGSRRKINLKQSETSKPAIAYALSVLNDISNLNLDIEGTSAVAKAAATLNHLQSKIQAARDAFNQLSNIINNDNTTCDVILRILEARVANRSQIGEDGNPTEQQVRHWQKHSGIFGDPSCPFCISEGKFEKGKNREKSIRNLSEFEALRLGLISRGFVQSKNNQDIWTKKNMDPIFLLPNGQVKNNKQVLWSKEHRSALIQDGKIHAKTFGFSPPPVFKREGCVVKKLPKLIQETQGEKLQRKVGKLTF